MDEAGRGFGHFDFIQGTAKVAYRADAAKATALGSPQQTALIPWPLLVEQLRSCMKDRPEAQHRGEQAMASQLAVMSTCT